MTIYSQIASNKLKSWMIIFVFLALISGIFYVIGQVVGDSSNTYLFLGLGISLLSGFGSYFYSDKIVLAMSGAKPASKEQYFDFYTVTENLAIAAGIPMPQLYVIDDPAPNAFATGRNPKHAVVAATTGLLSRLKRAEIEGVIAHELSHVRNYDILLMTIVTVLAGTVSYVIHFTSRGMMFGGGSDREERGNPLFLVLFLITLILAPLASTLIQLAVSRRREYLADSSGALLTRNPEGLASALEHISDDPHQMRTASPSTAPLFIANPFKDKNTGKFLHNLFSTHPPIEERIRILRSM